MTKIFNIDYARQLDGLDDLAAFRNRFYIGEDDLIYMDGNSLGRLPKQNVEVMDRLIHHEWGSRLIRSWNEAWFDLPERVGAKVARLVGAQPDEVIMADSTSVNLYRLALAALRDQPGRTKIVTDDLNFPSDLYILQGICKLLGPEYRLQVVPSKDGIHGPLEGLAEAIDQDTALVSLSDTVFKSGYTYSLAAVTEMAHRAGALILWDTSHSVGTRPIALDDADVDLAVGCSYKYLNGGPGAPAFLFVKKAIQDRLDNPISGWMGQKDLFKFGLDYQPVPGMRRFLSGTPPVISLAAVDIGVDMLLEAGLEKIRKKSIQQTQYLIDLWCEVLQPLGFRLNSPEEIEVRGSHISLGHDEGYRIDRALIEEKKILPDFREPDNLRIGIAPLYNSFEEIYDVVSGLKSIVEERLYEKYSERKGVVT